MITPALFSGIGTARAHTPSALFFPPAHFSGLTASSQPGPVPTVCSAAPRASSLLRSDPPRGGPVKPTTVIHPSIPLQTPAWQRSAVQFRCRATGRLVRPGHVDGSYSCPRCGHAGVACRCSGWPSGRRPQAGGTAGEGETRRGDSRGRGSMCPVPRPPPAPRPLRACGVRAAAETGGRIPAIPPILGAPPARPLRLAARSSSVAARRRRSGL